MQDYFKTKDFPKNMPAIWDAHFGFAKDLTGSAVVIGEWGGWRTKPPIDAVWQEAMGDYLIERDMRDQFWWCLNPDSGYVLTIITSTHPPTHPFIFLNHNIHPPTHPPTHPPIHQPKTRDTGGLVEEDWVTPIPEKLELLARVQPAPTKVAVDKAGKNVRFSTFVMPPKPKPKPKPKPATVVAPPPTKVEVVGAAAVPVTANKPPAVKKSVASILTSSLFGKSK